MARVEVSEKSRAIFFVTLLFWAIHCTVFTLSNALEQNPNVAVLAIARIGVSGVGFLFCYGILHLLRSLPRHSLKTRALALAVIAPVAAELFAWISYFAFAFATGRPPNLNGITWNASIVTLTMYTWFFFAWAVTIIALEYSFDRREDELRLAEYKTLAQSAKIRALHYQINPHLLFNSLNSLSALILERRIEDADLMVIRLSNFFRSTFSTDPLTDITLAEELKLQREYLGIEQVRYPDLFIDTDIPQDALTAMVPSMLLQPLIENAIKHGVARSPGGARISFSARRSDHNLNIVVENSGEKSARAESANGTGMGLKYVRERLASRFGDAYAFSANSISSTAYRVSLTIPWKDGRE